GVAAPSANRFGRVSPTSALDVVAELADRLDPGRDLVIDGGRSAVGVESTIVDCTGPQARVLRLGSISQAEVDAVLGVAASARTDRGVGAGAVVARGASAAGPSSGGASAGGVVPPGAVRAGPVRAPGTLDSHYAPRARVVLVEAADAVAALPGLASIARMPGLLAPASVPTPAGWTRLAAPAGSEQYAQELYAALRSADEQGLAALVAVLPPADGGPLAEAVRDRLTRAAHQG
ncbi:MAG TPA: Sua5 family C-terminal domain-containing protein, partial [Candidatus Nanopelagicales bacterium]